MQELGRAQLYVSAQDKRVDAFFLVRERPQRDGAGDVGRALQILRARVGEAEAARLHGNVSLLGRLVVDDRAVRAVGEDGVEALLKIVLTLGAKRFELFRRAELGDRLFADRVLEPVDEARDGHAVLDVGKALVLLLRGRFHRLHQLNGARAVEDFSALWHALQNAVVGALAVEQYAGARGQRRDETVDVVIGSERYAVRFQMCFDLCTHGLSLHAERGLVLLKQQIREEHGREEHVVAAQVQKPRDLVERGDDEHACAHLLHLAAHHCEFFPARQACILYVQLPHRLARERGAVRPHEVDKVLVARKADVLFARLFADRTGEVVADRARVEADPAVFRNVVAQERGDLRHAGLAHAHELNTAAL